MERYNSTYTGEEIDSAVENVGTLGATVSALSATVTALSSSVTRLSTDVSNMQNDLRQADLRISGLSGNVQQMSTSISINAGSITSLGSTVDGLIADVGTLSTSISVLETNKADINKLCRITGEQIYRRDGPIDLNPNWIRRSYTDLLKERKSGLLIPGRMYLITDYIPTVNKSYTTVMIAKGTYFGILVTALDQYHVSEKAYAVDIQQDGSYYKFNNLSAWRVWYCLDNDVRRFDWADDSVDDNQNPVGRGVIYRLIDEFGNDCPYDFKSIQFKKGNNYYFTFTADGGADASLNQRENCRNNVITPYFLNEIQALNSIVFYGIENTLLNCYNNYIGPNCSTSMFGSSTHDLVLMGNSHGIEVRNGNMAFSIIHPSCSYLELITDAHIPSQYVNLHTGFSGQDLQNLYSITLPVGYPGEIDLCPQIGTITYPVYHPITITIN